MTNNVVTFEPDQPQTVAFKYRTGKPFQGGKGYTYTLVSGLVTFFPPEVHKELEALHIDPGTPVTICKLGKGGWDIQRVTDGPPPEEKENRPASTFTPNSLQPTTKPTWGMSEMRRALFAVIEDAAEAERYAAGKGLSIRFDGCDIRTMANTIVIQGGR